MTVGGACIVACTCLKCLLSDVCDVFKGGTALDREEGVGEIGEGTGGVNDDLGGAYVN